MLVQDRSTIDKDAFLRAMSSLAGTIHVIATIEGGAPIGIIATSVCSLSAEPPSLVVCLNKETSAHDPILRQKLFSVNVLDASQVDVAQRFMTEKGAARFAHDSWMQAPGRIPVLLAGLASFDCELVNSYDGYSHTILIGKVVSLNHASDPRDRGCLLWHQRKFAQPAAVPA